MISIASLFLLLLFNSTASAQSRPAFEVASIKANTQAQAERNIAIFPGGRLTAQNMPLRLLIQRAHRVRPFQILGGPGWINSENWDIEARAEGSVNQQQVLLMLQSLIEERFNLKSHRETRELPIYELVVAKNGPKLPQPKEGSCLAVNPNAPGPGGPGAPPPPGPSGLPPAPPRPGAPGQPFVGPCGVITAGGGPAGFRMDGGKVTIAQVAQILTNMLDRSIVDKTGFTETFDVHLEFSFDEALAGLAADPNRPAFATNPTNPSIFTALEEQLGLKLESARGPVEVIVIDGVERPTEN
jgi:uncharacterized protein (TIGR03435 family)